MSTQTTTKLYDIFSSQIGSHRENLVFMTTVKVINKFQLCKITLHYNCWYRLNDRSHMEFVVYDSFLQSTYFKATIHVTNFST